MKYGYARLRVPRVMDRLPRAGKPRIVAHATMIRGARTRNQTPCFGKVHQLPWPVRRRPACEGMPSASLTNATLGVIRTASPSGQDDRPGPRPGARPSDQARDQAGGSADLEEAISRSIKAPTKPPSPSKTGCIGGSMTGADWANGPHNLAVLRQMALNVMQKMAARGLYEARSKEQVGMRHTCPGY
jgi:hypothetical protein